MTGLELAAFVVGLLVAAVTIVVATALALRAFQDALEARPLRMLKQRVARGEISVEQFFELESALKSPPPRRRLGR